MAGEVRLDARRFKLWAEIDGTRHPLVQAHIEYALSTIPRASVALAPGRALNTGQPAPIHAQLAALDEGLPISIYLDPTPHFATDKNVPDLGLPNRAVRLFEGRTAGVGVLADRSSMGIVVGANGWLAELAESSCLSATSHPANPGFFTAAALIAAPQAEGGAGKGGGSLVLRQRAARLLDPARLQTDLWDFGIRPLLESLAREDAFEAKDAGLKGSGVNDAALAALARIAAPLKLALKLGDGESILPYAVLDDLGQQLGDPQDTASGLTFWDVLIGRMAPDYGFALVPRVEDALIVPFVAGYRGLAAGPFRRLTLDQYDAVQLNQVTPRPLRSLSVTSSLASRSGANLSDQNGPDEPILGIGGHYAGRTTGQRLITPAPAWLARLQIPWRAVEEATGAAEAPVATTFHPRGAQPRKRARQEPAKKGAARAATAPLKGMLDRLAQARYVEEALRGRTGQLRCPLRLDLAPGSLVSFAGVAEPSVAGDQLGATFFGTVLQHGLSIHVEAGMAVSSLTLGHVRRIGVGDDGRSVGAHPLYTTTFLGAPLVQL